MRVIVTGARGMVGRALTEHCRALGDEVESHDHQSLDISDRRAVIAKLQDKNADVVINCAAWTDVDGCELDHERAYAVNAAGPENLAIAASSIDAGFISISTDYVFDGRKEGFYTQLDEPNPESVYGQAKLDGERRAQLAYARTTVVRSGFIFGPGGTNFLSTIVQMAARNQKLKVIRDCYGTPTYSLDLARRLRELAQLDRPGIYHVVNAGPGVSYEEFGLAALEEAGIDLSLLEPVSVDSLNRPAPRPRNSRLECLLSGPAGLDPLPFWKDSLNQYVSFQLQKSSLPAP